MGPIGAQEMIFIFLLALLLFGPKKLPELGRMLGKGLTEFRRAKNELKATFETHMHELERETRIADQPEPPKWEQSSSSSTQYSSASYPHSYDEYGRQENAGSSESAAANNGFEPSSKTEEHAPPSQPVADTVSRSASSAVSEPAAVASEHERSA